MSQLDEVVKYIKAHYDPEECGYTEERSQGNSTDVFEDGVSSGESTTLYTIGRMLGLELPDPVEPEYSF
mgnify:CR=1 FL=1